MKRSLCVFLTGLCLGALAEDLGKERVCTEEGCAATGDMLLQTRPAESGELDPLEEEEEEDEYEADDVDELIDLTLDKPGDKPRRGKRPGRKPKPLKPCDKMPKKKAAKAVARANKTIGKILQGIEKCYGRKKMRVMKLEKAMAHFKSCLKPKYGAFIEDAGSEGPEGSEDTADEPEELDELVELDDPEEPNELIDTDAEKPKRGLKDCDQMKEKKAKKIIIKIAERIKKVGASMDKCKTKRADKLEYFKKAFEHYKTCL